MSRILVLDFDGTMTDAETEGRPFRAGYLEDLCMLVGAREPAIREARLARSPTRSRPSSLAAPAEHRYLWKGKRWRRRRSIPTCGWSRSRNAILDGSARSTRSGRGGCSGHDPVPATTTTRPGRPGASATAPARSCASLAGTATFDRHELGHRGGRRQDRRARRRHRACWLSSRGSSATPRSSRSTTAGTAVRPSSRCPACPARSCPAPALPRLGCARCSTGPAPTFADLTVVGDIFELDLAMPLALGARVGLVGNPRHAGLRARVRRGPPTRDADRRSRRHPGAGVSALIAGSPRGS